MNKNIALVSRLLFKALFSLIAMTSLTSAAVWAQDLNHSLRRQLNFSEADLAALSQGKAITTLPQTKDKHETAAFGAIRLNATSESFVEAFRDIVNFKKGPNVLQIGKFSDPPRLEELQELKLSQDDLRAVKQCKIGDCDIKMSAAAILRFQKEVDWQAPDHAEQANSLFRQMLVEYGKAYLSVGDAALMEYSDKGYSLKLADEARSLLQASPGFLLYVPEFHRYLLEFPNAKLLNVENFLYWSVEKFGLKPVLSITHVSIYERCREKTTDVLIASRQIYASHYFEASLGLTAFIEDADETDAPRGFLLYLNRSRADALRGGFGGMKRALIETRVRSGMEKNLRLIRQKLEAQVAAQKK